ncbi:MAG: cupin domain-containing protein [Deltaproteobacteria bacterium]|nr:cupin domain-containing protein [Deltaproteobacteria bacterium]
MLFKIRRIVTSHDARGKAVVGTDDYIQAKPGVKAQEIGNALIWATDAMPADLFGDKDPAAKPMDLTPGPNGTIFRILELPPGTEPFMHRTDTIDYVIVMDGEVDMLLDDSEVHMKAGEVMVQRATWHGWANRSDKPCRIAFILIDARKQN